MEWRNLLGRLTGAEKADLRSKFAPQIANNIFTKANDTPQTIWRSGIFFVDVEVFEQRKGEEIFITCSIKKGAYKKHFNGSEQDLATIIETILDPTIKHITSTWPSPSKKASYDQT